MEQGICVFLITLLVGFFCFPNLVAIAQGGEDEAKIVQEKIK